MCFVNTMKLNWEYAAGAKPGDETTVASWEVTASAMITLRAKITLWWSRRAIPTTCTQTLPYLLTHITREGSLDQLSAQPALGRGCAEIFPTRESHSKEWRWAYQQAWNQGRVPVPEDTETDCTQASRRWQPPGGQPGGHASSEELRPSVPEQGQQQPVLKSPGGSPGRPSCHTHPPWAVDLPSCQAGPPALGKLSC